MELVALAYALYKEETSTMNIMLKEYADCVGKNYIDVLNEVVELSLKIYTPHNAHVETYYKAL